MLREKKWMLFWAGCALFLLSSAGLLLFYMRNQMRHELFLSLENGIYEEGTELKATIYGAGTIYYSVNGEENKIYEDSIVLSAGEDGCVYDMTFYCVFADGTESEQVERSYYVIRQDEHPMTTDYLVSVWGGEEELFSDESGIFVRGTQFYEYMEANPDKDVFNGDIPANYFSNEEVAVHTVVMDQSGEVLVDQDCGLNIYGNATRAKNQKSFRLTARREYDEENNTFDYPFFSDYLNTNGGEILCYKKLSLHNSGNDNGYGFIRNQLCNRLAGDAGFPDVLVSQSATVYVNGRYMGVYWLQNTYSGNYFEEKYGNYEGEMPVFEGTMSEVTASGEDTETLEKYAEEYNDLCEWVKTVDLQDETNYARVAETIDVENFLQYVAIEYYVNNIDWPNNNVKIYRYISPDGQYEEGTVFDGKYRYLLFDLDYGMGLILTERWFGRDSGTESLAELCIADSVSALFAKLMERGDCRNQFVNDVLDLRNGSFSYENTVSVMTELSDSRWSELTYMMEQTDILKDSLWEPDDNNINNVVEELQEIQYYSDTRASFVVSEMRSFWDLGDTARVVLAEDEKVEVLINGAEMIALDDIAYFAEIPVELSCTANAGIQVSGWSLNGTYVEGETVSVCLGEYAQDGIVEVAPVYGEQKCESLTITACRTSGGQDYVVLKNNGNVRLHLQNYYLSDDPDELYKGQLPNEILEPGESVTIYGECEDATRTDDYMLSFAWKEGESVILSHVQNGELERVTFGTAGEP